MNTENKTLFLKTIDHSVSKESFDLYRLNELDLLITSPQPDDSKLGYYYESEDYISHTDAKRSVFEKMYHYVKSIALKRKLKLINRLQPKGKLLDIGTGTGDFLALSKNNGWNVIGTEPNQHARETAERKGVTFVSNTSQLPDYSIDVITMWHVLEHVRDTESQIKELKRLIKPSGSIIIAVPNFNSYDAKHYGQFWAAYDVPRHLWHFSKTAISKLFAKENLKLVDVLPMKFDAFYVSLLSEKYKTGKIQYMKAFYIGLKSNLKAKKTTEYSSHIYIIKNI